MSISFCGVYTHLAGGATENFLQYQESQIVELPGSNRAKQFRMHSAH